MDDSLKLAKRLIQQGSRFDASYEAMNAYARLALACAVVALVEHLESLNEQTSRTGPNS